MFRRRLSSPLVLLGVGLALVGGCTSGTTLGSSGTVTLTTATPARTTGPTTSSSTVTITPVTPDGLVTGVGVDDATITLGLLVDPSVDRGFSTGVELWRTSVNAAGGLCGRTITTVANRSGETPDAGYGRIAGSVLGLITQPSSSQAPTVAARVESDQIPTLGLSGSSTDLRRAGPVVVGATEDIKAINVLAYLRAVGKLPEGTSVGVLTDASDEAANALAGARWWASRNGVSVVARSVGPDDTGNAWVGLAAVLVLAPAQEVAAVVKDTTAPTVVITDLSGYQPADQPDPGGRLLVTLAAPAYGSDNPGAAAVAKAFVAAGRTDPGPNLMSGYGVAAAWGRLLTQACVDRALTHSGVRVAMTKVGPASVDSLFGPSDPGLVVNSALPATRVSSVAQADPAAPGGLRPLIWLQAAPDIADYTPGR